MSQRQPFEITPSGAFSLAEANDFGFGHKVRASGPRMTLAFAVDGDFRPAGVELEQSGDGVVHGIAHGDAPLEAVVAQTARILSLDHDGLAWEQVLEAEPPLAELQRRAPGLRPVLFHSPYEAAAWSIISARVQRAQAKTVRDRIAARLGETFTLSGGQRSAFPAPERLLEGLDQIEGLADVKRDRLRGIAEAALDGAFDVDDLHRIGPGAATERMLGLTGIGPFYAMLIVVRASGFADVLASEPRARAAALVAYGLPDSTSDAEWTSLAERWKPFRTWATVLCRATSDRVPVS